MTERVNGESVGAAGSAGRVMLGEKEYAISLDVPDAQVEKAIQQLFCAAKKKGVTKPSDLKNITEVKNFSCHKKVRRLYFDLPPARARCETGRSTIRKPAASASAGMKE